VVSFSFSLSCLTKSSHFCVSSRARPQLFSITTYYESRFRACQICRSQRSERN
jgi:hypothetical protein